MKLRYLLRIMLTAWWILIPSLCPGQPVAVTVEGKVSDSTGNAVAYAVVALYCKDSADSQEAAAAGTAVTDDEGRYRIMLAEGGEYRLQCTHLAYETWELSVAVSADGLRYDITLTPSTEYMEAVEVVGTAIKYSAGKYEVKLEDSSLTRNRNAAELLGLLPGVTSHDGLKINGRAVDIVYIDGRRVVDREELTALQARNIETVVVQNSAGASEDATTAGGVIRITLRQPDSGSYYGTVSANTAFTSNMSKYNLPFTFNYQYGRVNIYNYFNAGYVSEYNDFIRREEFRSEGYGSDSDIRERYCNYSISDNIGVVYDISDRHSVGLAARAMWWNGSQNMAEKMVRSPLSGSGPDEESETVYRSGGGREIAQYQATLNYNYAIDTVGSVLELKADYMRFDQVQEMDYSTAADGSAPQRYRERYVPAQDMFDARMDLDKNFASGGRLSAGVRYYYNAAQESRRRENLSQSDWITPPDGLTSYFTSMQGSALFGEYSGSAGKFSYILGLRLQWDRLAYHGTNLSDGYRDYFRLFPSISAAYTFDPARGSNLNLDISRYSSGMPSSAALSPLPVRIAENSYRVGNPHLQPSATFGAGLTYTHRSRWTFSYRFSRAKGLVENLTTVSPQDPQVSIVTPVNLGVSFGHTLSAGINAQVARWLRLSVFLTGFYRECNYASLNYDEWYGELYTSLMFDILPGMGAQLAFSGSSPSVGLEYRSNGAYGLAGSIYKTFFNDRLYLSLTLSGLLYSRWQVNETVKADGSYRSLLKYRNHNREWIGVSVRFNFNSNVRKPFKTVRTLHGMQEEFKSTMEEAENPF